jgi:hypothetical protein
MKRLFSLASVLLLVGISVVAVDSADADGRKRDVFRAWMSGVEEAPNAVSSTGRGFFRAVVDEEAGTIEYRMIYTGLESPITQSHLHIGTHHQGGGIVIYLCSNLTAPAPPAGTQACPASPGEISGTITAENVLAQTNHGIAAGEFADVLNMMRQHAVYVNIHSTLIPAGEIRGQLVH